MSNAFFYSFLERLFIILCIKENLISRKLMNIFLGIAAYLLLLILKSISIKQSEKHLL